MPQTDGRWPVTEDERVRVGEVESPVLPGDINPENSLPYKAGQFAPSVDELSQDVLRAADDAGVLSSDLPIYEDGRFSARLLDTWEPAKDLAVLGFNTDTDLPKYATAVLLSSLKAMKQLPANIGLMDLVAAPRDAAVGSTGVVIIAAKFSSSGRKFRGVLEVYPDFFRFVSIPLAPRIPSQKISGISVATYAVFHALGHLMFARLSFDGNVKAIADVLGAHVWSRHGVSGSWGDFLGTPTTQTWRKSDKAKFQSELAGNSPSDDFAEAFALAFTNPAYLKKVFPEKYAGLVKVIQNVL